MGNWRTVDMTGKIGISDINYIRDFLKDDNCGDAWCFTMGGKSLCGLNNWVNDNGVIDISANLYERDFDNDDIERALKVLACRYHSLELTLHSGSDYEELVCTATFHVVDGTVTRCDPEVKTIRPCRCLTIDEYFTLPE